MNEVYAEFFSKLEAARDHNHRGVAAAGGSEESRSTRSRIREMEAGGRGSGVEIKGGGGAHF